MASVPQQDDNTDCGVYVLITLMHLAIGKLNSTLGPLDTNLWRLVFTVQGGLA